MYSTTDFLRAAFLWEVVRVKPEIVPPASGDFVSFVWREQLPLSLLLEEIELKAPDGTTARVNMQQVGNKYHLLKRAAFNLLKEREAKNEGETCD